MGEILSLVKYEIARLLKEKGFDLGVREAYVDLSPFDHFDSSEVVEYLHEQNHNLKEHRYSAPTQALTLKWLRNVHKLHCQTFPFNNGDWTWGICFYDQPIEGTDGCKGMTSNPFEITYDSCEKAEEAAIEYCLKNLL